MTEHENMASMQRVTDALFDALQDYFNPFDLNYEPNQREDFESDMWHAAEALSSLFAPARPFGADGHGLGCAFRRGHDCDCTARTSVYLSLVTPKIIASSTPDAEAHP